MFIHAFVAHVFVMHFFHSRSTALFFQFFQQIEKCQHTVVPARAQALGGRQTGEEGFLEFSNEKMII